jgi:saxitoxin biosynthesis operon SxtJ-like protein
MKKHQKPYFQERSFGVSVGGVLIAIAAYFAWRGQLDRTAILGGVGAILVVLGLTAPRLLKYPSMVWWKFAMVLGYINARVILTIAFAIVLVPVSLAWRLIGHDPLTRKRSSWHGWSPSPERFRSPDHFTRMY